VIAVTPAAPGREPSAPRLLARSGAEVVAVSPHGRRAVLLHDAVDAVFSPDGTQIAFARDGDLWTANADGSGQRRLASTPRTADAAPAWLPDGSGLVYEATVGGRRRILVFRLPTGPSHRIVAGPADAWSPAVSRRGRLAFVSDRSGVPEVYVSAADGSEATPFDPPAVSPGQAPADIRDLAWSPDSRRLAYTSAAAGGATSLVLDDGVTRSVLAVAAAEPRRPIWSPDGSRIAFTDAAGALRTVGVGGDEPHQRGTGTPTSWQIVATGAARYPNLVQRPPTQLTVLRKRARWLLAFTSLVDNRGPGVLQIRARRPPGARVMPVDQLIQVAGGWTRLVPGAGQLDFAVARPHFHWHYLAFDRYELRSADSLALAARDRKEGFCLSDRYGVTPGMPHGPPRFKADCSRGRPGARAVVEGLSVGYTDRYLAVYEGQSLDLTTLPAGLYWLVNRANPDFHLRELRYDDDAASLLLRLAWPHGHAAPPRIVVLRACRQERC
jgi:Lysyl oxidase/WD40-like Beta Propeller Repeat